MRPLLGEVELTNIKKLRYEGNLDEADAILGAAEPTPATFDEFRKNASARAKAAKKAGDWAAVVQYLEGYTVLAQRFHDHCIKLVNQAPPEHTATDKKLLEDAKAKLQAVGQPIPSPKSPIVSSAPLRTDVAVKPPVFPPSSPKRPITEPLPERSATFEQYRRPIIAIGGIVGIVLIFSVLLSSFAPRNPLYVFVTPTPVTPTTTSTPSITFTPSLTFTPSATPTNTATPTATNTFSATDLAQTKSAYMTATVAQYYANVTATVGQYQANATATWAGIRATQTQIALNYLATLEMYRLSNGSGGSGSSGLTQPQSTTAPSGGGVRIGAVCGDGSTSSATGSGACSHHRGVAYWLYSNLYSGIYVVAAALPPQTELRFYFLASYSK